VASFLSASAPQQPPRTNTFSRMDPSSPSATLSIASQPTSLYLSRELTRPATFRAFRCSNISPPLGVGPRWPVCPFVAQTHRRQRTCPLFTLLSMCILVHFDSIKHLPSHAPNYMSTMFLLPTFGFPGSSNAIILGEAHCWLPTES
jgi:hypothetical protein